MMMSRITMMWVSGVMVMTSGVMMSPTRTDRVLVQALSMMPATSMSSMAPQMWTCLGRMKIRMSCMEIMPASLPVSSTTIMPKIFRFSVSPACLNSLTARFTGVDGVRVWKVVVMISRAVVFMVTPLQSVLM